MSSPHAPTSASSLRPSAAAPGPSETRRIAGLAWPSSLSMLAMMGMNVIDTICVGHLGPEAQGGVSVAIAFAYTGGVIVMGITRALDPIVSQAHGAGDREAAGQALVRMLALGVPLSLLVAAWYCLAGPGLALLGQPATLVRPAGAYASALAWSVPAVMAISTLRQFLQALGIVRPTLIIMTLGTLVKAPINLALIYGFGPIPAFGVAGAGYATAVVDVGIVAGLAWAVRDTLRAYWPASPRLDMPAMVALLRVGLPIGVQMGTEIWAFSFLAVMMGWLGEVQAAAHSTALTLASVSFMIPLGISTAASARVGHLIGAGEDWRAAVRSALRLGVVTQLYSALIFLLGARWLVMPFSSDPDVRAAAAALMPIAAAFQLFDGLQVIGFGLLRGAGDVRVPTVANLIGYYCLGLPLAYWLGIQAGGGAPAMWWGLTLGLFGVSATLMVRLRMTMVQGGYRVRA